MDPNRVRGKGGFTLLEALLGIAIMGIIGGFSVPFYYAAQVRGDADDAVIMIAQNLRRAQLLAQAGEGDAPWGLYVQQGSMILFKGSSFGSRDQDEDEVFTFTANMGVSGNQEFVFAKMTGEPVLAGTINLLLSTNEQRTVSVNEKGMISY